MFEKTAIVISAFALIIAVFAVIIPILQDQPQIYIYSKMSQNSSSNSTFEDLYIENIGSRHFGEPKIELFQYVELTYNNINQKRLFIPVLNSYKGPYYANYTGIVASFRAINSVTNEEKLSKIRGEYQDFVQLKNSSGKISPVYTFIHIKYNRNILWPADEWYLLFNPPLNPVTQKSPYDVGININTISNQKIDFANDTPDYKTFENWINESILIF
jgi:hypothetical protein